MLSIGGLVLPIGLDRGIIRFGGEKWPGDPKSFQEYLTQSFTVVSILGIAFSVLLYLSAPWFAEEVFKNSQIEEVLRWISPAFALISVLRFLAAASRVSQRMKYGVISEDITPPLVFLFLFIILFALGFEIRSALIGLTVSYFFGVLLVLRYIGQLFPGALHWRITSRNRIPELIAFSLPVSLAGLFATLIIWLNRLMVGYFRPEVEVGFYQASSQVSLIFVIILGATNAVFTPIIVKLIAQRQINALNDLYKITTKWGFYASIPFFLVILVAPNEIMGGIFGSKFIAGSQVLSILAIGQFINVASGSVGQILVMSGHHILWMRVSLLMLSLSLVLNTILSPLIGMNGAAIATTIGIGSLNIIGLFIVQRKLKLNPYDVRYLKGIFSGFAALVVMLILRGAIDLRPALFLLLIGIIGSAVMLISLLVMKLDEEDFVFLRSLLRLVGSHTEKRDDSG